MDNKHLFYKVSTFVLLFFLLGIVGYTLRPIPRLEADVPAGYLEWTRPPDATYPYYELPYANGKDHLADVNSDGLVDVLDLQDNVIYFNTGNGFTWQHSASLAALPLYRDPGNPGSPAGIRVVDINNDGLADILQSYVVERTIGDPVYYQGVYINTGSSWEQDSRYSLAPGGFGSDKPGIGQVESDVRFTDVNGDNLLDIIYVNHQSDGFSTKVYLASPK